MTANNDAILPIIRDDGTPEGKELRTKADIAWCIRMTSYKEGQADMLADLFGGDIDNDPLAFLIACNIRYIKDISGIEFVQGLIDIYSRKYPKATARALELRPMSGKAFYEKYGEKEILDRWKIVYERNGVEIWDLFQFENPAHQQMVIQAGEELKSAILWCMAGDWLNDLLEFTEYALDPEDVGAILGDY